MNLNVAFEKSECLAKDFLRGNSLVWLAVFGSVIRAISPADCDP